MSAGAYSPGWSAVWASGRPPPAHNVARIAAAVRHRTRVVGVIGALVPDVPAGVQKPIAAARSAFQQNPSIAAGNQRCNVGQDLRQPESTGIYQIARLPEWMELLFICAKSHAITLTNIASITSFGASLV